MEFQCLIQRAIEIRESYAKFEKENYGQEWTISECALGFVGDVGDLMKLIMAHEGVRKIPDLDRKLAHEFADCLWSIIVLAQKCGVNLEESFLKTMDELETKLLSKDN